MDDGSAPDYEFGGFRLDTPLQVLMSREGEPIPLPSRAYEVLIGLVERAGELIEESALMAAVWPRAVVEENNLYAEAGNDSTQEHARTVALHLDDHGAPLEPVRPLPADASVIQRPELTLAIGPDPTVYAYEKRELLRNIYRIPLH